MHEAGALVVRRQRDGGARRLVEATCEHAFNAAGGLHHAMPAARSGFCVYDDPAVGDRVAARSQGAERIAYVDVDVHHGDGVQSIFYGDPRVLTVSIHEYAPWFFPGTGAIVRAGRAGCRGERRERAAAAVHRRRRVARCVPLRGARRSSGASRPTSWSRSSGATRTPRTRSRRCCSRPARTVRPRRSCTRWRTMRPAAGGSPPAAAGTSGRAWSRARGRSRSRRWRRAELPDEIPERLDRAGGVRAARRGADGVLGAGARTG